MNGWKNVTRAGRVIEPENAGLKFSRQEQIKAAGRSDFPIWRLATAEEAKPNILM